nr:unnamed protein product [Callosobruchus analis]
MDTEGNILIKDTDSGNIPAIEQPRIDFNENYQPFIKDTNIILGYETAATSDTVSEPSEQDPVLDNSAQNSLFDSSTHCQQDVQDTVLDNSAQNSLFDSSTHWQHDETLALISAVEARYEDLYHPQKRRWFWDVISESLSSDGINFEAKKCKKKWENLIRTYKNTKDKKNKSGRCPVRFVYFDRLDELLGEKPNNCSPHIIDVGASTSSQVMETVASPVVADQVVENCPQQENIGKLKYRSKQNIVCGIKEKYYDHKATVYEEYTKKKLALMERKVVLEERKITALETIAANSSKK